MANFERVNKVVMKMHQDIMVTVCVCTYNQEQWIRQTLDSILAQQTDYPFEVIIGEDHGTDGTRAICQEYADKYDNVTLLPSTQNLGVTANWIQCIQAGSGKYIMNCAGDDYWHNPYKIQLQVDFMESHPECVICHTDNDHLNVVTGHITLSVRQNAGIAPPQGYIQNEVYGGAANISALTCCYRRFTFEQYVPTDKYIELGLLGEDYPTWVIMSGHGTVNYIPISTATYRVGQLSITSRVNYDWLRHRYETEKKQAKWLMEMFPNLGTYTEADDKYYDDYCSHQLLLAAYRSNDYASARKFAKQDKMPNWKTRMARTWLTFQIARIYSIYKA